MIKPGTLAEYLYVNCTLNDLAKLLLTESFGELEQLSQEWKLSIVNCKKQIELAIYHIKQD